MDLADRVEICADDLLYLVRLADWAAGQGFCQIDGIEDPEEWCFRKWSEHGSDGGTHVDYSADALAVALRARKDKAHD